MRQLMSSAVVNRLNARNEQAHIVNNRVDIICMNVRSGGLDHLERTLTLVKDSPKPQYTLQIDIKHMIH